VNCAFQIAPSDAAPVYVDVRGQVAAIHVENGAVVQAGDPLLTLRNHDLELAVIELEGELRAVASVCAAWNFARTWTKRPVCRFNKPKRSKPRSSSSCRRRRTSFHD
jgi:hypothetical protein